MQSGSDMCMGEGKAQQPWGILNPEGGGGLLGGRAPMTGEAVVQSSLW